MSTGVSAPGDDAHRFSCLELRGGNHRDTWRAELPGLDAWVSCHPVEPSPTGGDLYYLSVCSTGSISRITLADVAGHGAKVSDAATCLRDALRLHADQWDQSSLIKDLNDTFLKAVSAMDQESGAALLAYATAFLISYFGQTGEVLFTNAGHPLPLWYRSSSREWLMMQDDTTWSKTVADLPLGLIPGTAYTQTAIQLAPEDVLLLYTDGISEAVNSKGERLGSDRLLEMARSLPTDSAREAGSALLEAIQAYRNGAPATDDTTIVALQRTDFQPRQVFVS